MLNFKNSLLAATMLLAVPQLAQAQNISGVYLGVGAGLNFMEDQHIKASSLPPPVGGVAMVFQPGWAGVGSVGYGFGNGFRVELEGNYRTNHLRGQYPVSTSSHSDEEKYGAMFNVLYDFNMAGTSLDTYSITPYLGLGAGLMHNSWEGVTIQDGAGRVHINNSVNDFAFQGIAGLAFPITSVPGLAVTLEYRLVDEPRSRNYTSLYTSPDGNFGFNSKVLGDINHSALIGVRYAFDTVVQAAPAPAPAPAPPAPLAVTTAVWVGVGGAPPACIFAREGPTVVSTSETQTHGRVEGSSPPRGLSPQEKARAGWRSPWTSLAAVSGAAVGLYALSPLPTP